MGNFVLSNIRVLFSNWQKADRKPTIGVQRYSSINTSKSILPSTIFFNNFLHVYALILYVLIILRLQDINNPNFGK